MDLIAYIYVTLVCAKLNKLYNSYTIKSNRRRLDNVARTDIGKKNSLTYCFSFHSITVFIRLSAQGAYLIFGLSGWALMRVSAASPRGRPPGNPRATQGLGRGFVAKACPTRGALECLCVFGKIPRGHTHGIYT